MGFFGLQPTMQESIFSSGYFRSQIYMVEISCCRLFGREMINWRKRGMKLSLILRRWIRRHFDDVPMSEKMYGVKKSKKDAGEEAVDIGDEMPESSFPHVKIEKDDGGGGQGQAVTGGGQGNNDKIASSSSSGSSSSSSSGSSSSSDSDSGSSSGSDSDADDAQS